jgi:hypothetical protein
MPDLRRQCRPPPAPCARVQPRQLHADAGDTQDGASVVANQPAREADQDRRKGRQPRALRDLPDGRGGGAATDVRRHPVADRPAARTASTRMRATGETRRATTPEVRPDAGGATRLSTSTRSTKGFDRLPGTRHAICRCSRRPKGRSSSHDDRESGECRLINHIGLSGRSAPLDREDSRCLRPSMKLRLPSSSRKRPLPAARRHILCRLTARPERPTELLCATISRLKKQRASHAFNRINGSLRADVAEKRAPGRTACIRGERRAGTDPP